MSDHMNDKTDAVLQDASRRSEHLKELSAFSAKYRDACAGTVQKGRMNIVEVQLGHGTGLICMAAAVRCGARSILFVAPTPSIYAYADQLTHMGYNAKAVGRRKGAMADACRLAADKIAQGISVSQPDILFATPWQMAEAGHWLESRPGKQPFDFVAILDPAIAKNLKSERGQDLYTVVARAGTSLIPVDPPTVGDETMLKLTLAWGTGIIRPPMDGLPSQPAPVIQPDGRRYAATACEAMCMD